ncbi:hypothetical protein BC835DRAFT_1423076 [Cytidiella melzeri]|nr:hypothetical protein BC835DRAFT_1423076 [Cytidiella melzeri]
MWWRFVNLDKRCAQSPTGGYRLGEFFFRPGLPLSIYEFTIPSPLSSKVASLTAKSPRIMHCSSSPNSRLLRCPEEIILLVFREIDQLSDAACFALADGKLFRIGLARIEELQRLYYSIWAGDRVLLIGGRTNDDDYPESVQDTVNEELRHAQDVAEEDASDNSKFCYLASECYERPFRPGDVWKRHRKLIRHKDKDARNYKALVKRHHDDSSLRVLCNISKGEFVRQTSIKDLPFYADLGHAMLSRICWATDDSIGMAYGLEDNKNPLHRGSWAGDRFEVTTMDRLRSNIEWRDVSKEVADTLRDIYRSEYGSAEFVYESSW